MSDDGRNAAETTSPGVLHAKAWAEAYELIDRQLSPLGLRAIEALGLRHGDHVADIGCGAGQTLIQLAERVGPRGRVTGVDLAPRLVEIARRRTRSFQNIDVVQANAQTYQRQAKSLDAVFSRFGVMAFDDPVAAFANFRRMLKPSGVLAFMCWRSLRENALDHVPLAASGVEATIDETPFSFADAGHTTRMLAAAGFSDIVAERHDEMVSSGDLDAMTKVVLSVGALGKVLRENPALRADAEPRVREALAALGDPLRVQLLAAVWIVTARPGRERSVAGPTV